RIPYGLEHLVDEPLGDRVADLALKRDEDVVPDIDNRQAIIIRHVGPHVRTMRAQCRAPACASACDTVEFMEMRESFRAPFLAMAWQRHARIADLVSRGDVAELRSAASELHCLSGEASMLDFKGVAEAARLAEKA